MIRLKPAGTCASGGQPVSVKANLVQLNPRPIRLRVLEALWMPQEQAGSYRSYLLRCWQEARANSKQPGQWRFVLQDVVHAQNRHAFGNFKQLVEFLRRELPGEVDVAEDDLSPQL